MEAFEKWYAAYDRTHFDACPEEAINKEIRGE